MQILMSLFALILVGAIMAAVLTFGFILFAWLTMAATIWYLYVILRRKWREWRGEPPEEAVVTMRIIEGEYKDVSGE